MPSPLSTALERSRSAFPGPPSDALLWDLEFDAVWARANHGEFDECVPRLLELVVADGCGDTDPWAVFAAFAERGREGWDDTKHRAMTGVADAWWSTLLRIYPYPPGIDEVLASLSQLDLPLVRWLHPFPELLDGPGAQHFADLVLHGLNSAGWDRVPDTRTQVEGWTRSEPAVMGITLVGGVHLEPGCLGAVLDRVLDDT